MGVTAIGVPGQPLNTPPLTAWQAAVRDALNSSDVPVDSRIAAATANATVLVTPGTGWTGSIRLRRQGGMVHCQVAGLTKASPVANEVIGTWPAGYKPASGAYAAMFTLNVGTGSGKSELVATPTGLQTFAAPIAGFGHTGAASWYTADAWPA